MTAIKFVCAIAILMLSGMPRALSFDYARYEAADLDELIAQRRPGAGVDIYRGRPFKLAVRLAAQSEPCAAGLLKKTMLASGFPKDAVDGLPVTRCIKVRSLKGAVVQLFVQDTLVSSLRNEVAVGQPLTLFAIHSFTGPDGPGLLVNEFQTQGAGSAANASTSQVETKPWCGCGPPDLHPGVDYAGAQGTPVTAVDEGIVVKVEDDEQAVVDTASAGRCGRYIVIKRTYPNGRVAFLRYAQLGGILGADGKPVVLGASIETKQKIGEVGKLQTLHFEIRPLDPATMDQSAHWTQRYGADPTMEWSRFQPVDPQSFDPDSFARATATAK